MDEIRGVAVDVEVHVSSVKPGDGFRLRDCVVHEHVCLLEGVGCGQSLLGANFIECKEHCGVDGARDVKASASNDLHVRGAAFIKFWCSCGVGRVLHLGPIRGRETFLGRVLGAREHGVLEALQGVADRFRHGYVDVISRIVPFDGKPAVLASRWVDSEGVILPECVKEVGGVVDGKELDTKVIYNEGEGGRQSCVGPKTGGVHHRSVAVGLEVTEKALVGDDFGFL